MKGWYSLVILACSLCFINKVYINICRNQVTRSHLKNVYAALTLSTFLAAGGAAVHLFTDILKVCLLFIHL